MKKHSKTNNIFLIQALLSLVLYSIGAKQVIAADFCVNSAATFQSALTTAQNNNFDDVIRVVKGTYFTPGSPFQYSSNDGRNLQVLGGYTNSCSSRELIPTNTILDGNNSNSVLSLFHTVDGGNLKVEGFTIQNGKTTSSGGSGAGLSIKGEAGFDGVVDVASNIFRFNVASGAVGGALVGGSSIGGGCLFINNLFHDNSALNFSAGSITCNGSNVLVSQNTVTENTSISLHGGLRIGGAAKLTAVNNILWSNSGDDLIIQSNSNVLLGNNIDDQRGGSGAGSTGNISADPKFVSISDFHLLSNSPSGGTGDISDFVWFVTLPVTDLDGNPRLSENKIDMGAYQTDLSELCVVIPVKLSGAVVVCL